MKQLRERAREICNSKISTRMTVPELLDRLNQSGGQVAGSMGANLGETNCQILKLATYPEARRSGGHSIDRYNGAITNLQVLRDAHPSEDTQAVTLRLRHAPLCVLNQYDVTYVSYQVESNETPPTGNVVTQILQDNLGVEQIWSNTGVFEFTGGTLSAIKFSSEPPREGRRHGFDFSCGLRARRR